MGVKCITVFPPEEGKYQLKNIWFFDIEYGLF